jgi:hypothetical protein
MAAHTELAVREAALLDERERLERGYGELALKLKANLGALKALEDERLVANSGLTPKEIADCRQALTVIARAVSSEDVIFGSVRVIDEDPEPTEGGYRGNHTNKYSIHIESKFVEDYACGLEYNVRIKTRNAGVKAILNSLIKQVGYVDEADLRDGEWTIDWDFHQRVAMRSS